MNPHSSGIVETTSDHVILEKTRSESFDRAANVDIMFSLFSDGPPILPLKEECLSAGVELVYKANGAGNRAIYEEKKRRKAELLREIEHLETKLGGEERCHIKGLDHETFEGNLKKDEWIAKVICARMKLTKEDDSFGVSYQAYSKEVEKMNQARISDIQSCHSSDDSIDELTNDVQLERCIDHCLSSDNTPVANHSDYEVHGDADANHSDYGVHGDAEASQNQIMSKKQEQPQENKAVDHERSSTCTSVTHDYSLTDTDGLTGLNLVSFVGRRIPQDECSNDSVSRVIVDHSSIDTLTNNVQLERVDSVCIDRCPSADNTPVANHSDYEVHGDADANHSDYGVHGDAEASQNQIMSKKQEQPQENKVVDHEHKSTCTSVTHDYSLTDTDGLTGLSLISFVGRRISQDECSDDSAQTTESVGNYFNDSVSQFIVDDSSRASDASLESILGDDQDMRHWESRAQLDETEESQDTIYKDLVLCIVSLISFFGCVYNRDDQLLRLHLENQMNQNQCECNKLAEDVAKFVVKEIREDEKKKVSGFSERSHKSSRNGRDILSVCFVSFVLFMASTFYRNTQATDLRLQELQLKFALQALEIQHDSRDKLVFELMNEILSDAAVYRTQDASQRMPSPSPFQSHAFLERVPINNHVHNVPMFDFYYVNSMLD